MNERDALHVATTLEHALLLGWTCEIDFSFEHVDDDCVANDRSFRVCLRKTVGANVFLVVDCRDSTLGAAIDCAFERARRSE